MQLLAAKFTHLLAYAIAPNKLFTDAHRIAGKGGEELANEIKGPPTYESATAKANAPIQ